MKNVYIFSVQRIKAKLQWVQDPSQSNVDNLYNIRRQASKHFRNKKKAYLKVKIEEFDNSKIKNIMEWYRRINDFKKFYQSRTNTGKDDKGVLVADSHSILVRWRKYFSKLLNKNMVNGVRQTEIQRTEQLVPEPNAFAFEMPIEH